MRAKETDDLLVPESWTFASELPFCDILPGYKVNSLPLDYFGIPFFPQNYPARLHVGAGRMMHPMGWLETNVIQILDKEHYWYDPEERTFHLLMRANTGGTCYAAIAKVIEHSNGQMTTMLESVPSGKRILFLPLPGGHLRFHVLYDEVQKLYWLLSSQPTDSMKRTECLPSSRYALPNCERNRLVLHFSKNIIDWCFAGLVDKGNTELETRCYASMAISGDDLIIASRSGSGHNDDARDTDIIMFHRVRNFRALVY
jgi:hypothetical protein